MEEVLPEDAEEELLFEELEVEEEEDAFSDCGGLRRRIRSLF